MARLDFTALAAKDLLEIVRYTKRRWGPQQARRYREELELVLQKVSVMPEIGREREELAPRVRSFVVGSHVGFYVPRRGGITIVRLLHSRMDVERASRQE